MKTRLKYLSLIIILIFPLSLNGQVGNFLKNKMNRAMNVGARTIDDRINREIDTAVQEGVSNAMDKEESKLKSSSAESNGEYSNSDDESGSSNASGKYHGGFNMANLLGGKVDIKYNDQYDFTSRLYMQTETYDKKDVKKMDLYMYYSEKRPSIGIETGELSQAGGEGSASSLMIIDGENKCFIILTDVNGQKMGLISSLPEDDSVYTEKENMEFNSPDITKTGNTKMIAGYKCDEYIYKDSEDNTTGKVWFSKDVDLNVNRQSWSKAGLPAYYGYSTFENGVIMGWESYDDKGDLTAKSETKEINTNYNHSVSLKDYTLRQLNVSQGEMK